VKTKYVEHVPSAQNMNQISDTIEQEAKHWKLPGAL
jgi:hypothetical protein